MEQYELELIAKYGDVDEDLHRLWQEHLEYEKQLDVYENKPYLTWDEEAEMKRLKKMKLAGKTRIQNILEKYRRQEAGNGA
ncbi:MAG: YdcH family protein [Desulfovermiculus sp.]